MIDSMEGTRDPSAYRERRSAVAGVTVWTRVTDGSASVDDSIGKRFASIGQPHLSDCTVIEIVAASVVDPNGNAFAVPGVRVGY